MSLVERAREVGRAYSKGEQRPLGGYLTVITTFSGLAVAAAASARLLGRRPTPVSAADLVLLGLGTHKASRLIAKDAVTSPLRAPFTSFAGAEGEAEVSEEVRGTGVRHAAGELITCPFCLAPWTAGVFVGGLSLAPRATRAAVATLAAVAISDFLQLAYAMAKQRTTPPEERGD